MFQILFIQAVFFLALVEHSFIVTPFENPTVQVVSFYSGALQGIQLYWEFRFTDTS